MRLETVREQDAYDAGFAEGKDYWMPLEQARIMRLLSEHYPIGYVDGSTYCGAKECLKNYIDWPAHIDEMIGREEK